MCVQARGTAGAYQGDEGVWNPPGPDVGVPASPEPESRVRESDGPEHQSRLLSPHQGRSEKIKTSESTVVPAKPSVVGGVPEGETQSRLVTQEVGGIQVKDIPEEKALEGPAATRPVV